MVHLLVVQTGIECSTDFCNSPLLLLPIFSMLQTAAVISCGVLYVSVTMSYFNYKEP
jgi:hypothetical protein